MPQSAGIRRVAIVVMFGRPAHTMLRWLPCRVRFRVLPNGRTVDFTFNIIPREVGFSSLPPIVATAIRLSVSFILDHS